ncbi:hypothetical protein [Trichococcus palustris]|uniref:hypothetical protein n=1 Tax=Trichococcus palustris TaxID=140314 RepID=UPI00117D69E1|nr:hypothetical protein [Trichococcus palustris]
MAEQLDEKITEFDQEISTTEAGGERKQLRSQRKIPKQYSKLILEMAKRKQKYQRDMMIFGERNSYSKTDHDATFMRMKEDYMKNGQLKAGYNMHWLKIFSQIPRIRAHGSEHEEIHCP